MHQEKKLQRSTHSKGFKEMYDKLNINTDKIPRPKIETFENYANQFQWPEMKIEPPIKSTPRCGSSDNSVQTLRKYA